ncbi:MAG: glycoside hydrolase family 3 N-terminal domain-containing protein [Breznakia sp.]
MKKVFIFLVVGCIITSILWGSSMAVDATTRVDDLLAKMSTKQKIAQMLMPDFRQWKTADETSVSDLEVMNEEVATIVDQYDLGGVILFAKNVKSTEQTGRLPSAYQDAAIHNAAGNGEIPLLLTVDQEGGIVYRLGSGTALPGNMAIGATRSVDDAKNVGEIIGREVSSLGMNVNFAPVMDVNNNPLNPVIGLRSISSDANLVAQLAIPMMQGVQSYNVATSAKHFPGHGDTATDSHSGLPLVNKSYEELKALELVPFQAAVDNGVDMLMTAHIQYPQIDSTSVVSISSGEEIYLPATLSKKILTDVVRKDMNFDGIVITDAMNMSAISSNFGEIEAIEMAIYAGADIVLMPTTLRSQADITKLDAVFTHLLSKAQADSKFMSRVDESVTRILELKEKRGILDYQANNTSMDDKLAKANQEVGSDLNRSLERRIARDAVTITKNEENVLPIKVKSDDKVLMLAAYNNEIPGMKLAINRMMSEGNFSSNATVEYLRYSSSSTLDDFKTQIDDSQYVVVISEIGSTSQLKPTHWLTKMPSEIIDYANTKNVDSVILSISKPYDTANYPHAKAILAVYGNKGMDPTENLQPDAAFGPNIPAGVEIIFGNADAKGKLPVDVPAINQNHDIDISKIAYPFGYGLTYRDPVDDITLSLPSSINTKEDFLATISLGDLQSLSKQDYQVQIVYDTDYFMINNTKNSKKTEVKKEIIIRKKANDTSDIILTMQGKSLGKGLSPIQTIRIIDAKDRIFSMGDGYYISNTVDINDVTTPDTGGSGDGSNIVMIDPKKPTVGVETSDISNLNAYVLTFMVTTWVILLVGYKKRFFCKK